MLTAFFAGPLFFSGFGEVGEDIAALLTIGYRTRLVSLLAFLLLRRLGRVGDIFDRVSDVLALVAACALASRVCTSAPCWFCTSRAWFLSCCKKLMGCTLS